MNIEHPMDDVIAWADDVVDRIRVSGQPVIKASMDFSIEHQDDLFYLVEELSMMKGIVNLSEEIKLGDVLVEIKLDNVHGLDNEKRVIVEASKVGEDVESYHTKERKIFIFRR